MSFLLRNVRRLSVLILALLLISPTAHAQDSRVEVTVEIKGADGSPKSQVAVDVLGPARVFAETNAQGVLEVSLPPGSYVFRVRERGRRMKFERQVARPDPPAAITLKLKVNW